MTDAGLGDSERLQALQALRAVAAALIVFLHAEELVRLHAEAHGNSFTLFKTLPLGAGVDLFFVISGFVIVFASRKLFATPGGWLEFMRRRLIRIVPLYWTALTLRLLVLATGAAIGAKAFPDLTAIVTSYLFIPHDSLGFGPEYPFPILDLGWTLNFEMFFYVLFACFIALPRERAVAMVVAALAGGVVLATIFQPEAVTLRFWLQPITWEFAFGALIATAFMRGVVLPAPVRIAMILAALLIWLVPVSWLGHSTGPGFYGWPRLAIWGTGAILIVAAAVLGPVSFRSAWSQLLARLGDSSYALYLLHPFVFIPVKAVLAKVAMPQLLYWPLVLATTALAIACAAAFHAYVENPVVLCLRRMTSQRKVLPRNDLINDGKELATIVPTPRHDEFAT
ncbi:acyltransferase [Bradyrhizobium sp. I71]|uniref:acyltransferase family protein n=1 Tax=Bradyrhizobium sp. I71 TaxID=2590772 RepID=UPI001EF7FC76|nr:acyltransferase [Bradyrhizobium sp. I71]ULK95957.1 acyltransferase [Bradyrhizobium sp. I71]